MRDADSLRCQCCTCDVCFHLFPKLTINIPPFIQPASWITSRSPQLQDKVCWASLVAQMVKNLPEMQGTLVQSLGQEDPSGEGNGNPCQYSCLENPMGRGDWRAKVHGVAKSWSRLNDQLSGLLVANKWNSNSKWLEQRWEFRLLLGMMGCRAQLVS